MLKKKRQKQSKRKKRAHTIRMVFYNSNVALLTYTDLKAEGGTAG